MNWKSNYGRVTFGVDSTLLGVRDTKQIESSFNNGISLDDNRKESQTPPSNGHTASSFTQSSVKVDSTTPVESLESFEQKQQINWIDRAIEDWRLSIADWLHAPKFTYGVNLKLKNSDNQLIDNL